MSTRIGRLAGIVARVVCIGLLALPLSATAEAAVKQKKATVKSKPAPKKHATGKQAKLNKAKLKTTKAAARKPVAKKLRVATLHKTQRHSAFAKTSVSAVRQPQKTVASVPAIPPPVAEDSPRPANTACRRNGKIYLLADCSAPLSPALLAATADRNIR